MKLLYLGQPNVNMHFSKFMKRPQTKFHVDAISYSNAIRSKKVKIVR